MTLFERYPLCSDNHQIVDRTTDLLQPLNKTF